MVRRNSNVILTRQTCGHSSSRVAGSKRRALAFSFSVRIWYIFLISKCRGKSDQGLRIAPVLAERMRPHSADFRFKNVFSRRICRKSALRSRILFPSTEVMHDAMNNIIVPLYHMQCHLAEVRIVHEGQFVSRIF